MEEGASALSEIVEWVSACTPRHSSREDEVKIMSRDFWMPDRSCRMCYECESQFTIFNRRHHCRICGKVFCGRCTLNTIPAPVNSHGRGHDENERVRVCNYCFKVHSDRAEQDYINREFLALHSPPTQTVSSSEPPGHTFNNAVGPVAMDLVGKHDSSSTSRPRTSSDDIALAEPEDVNPACALCTDAQPKSSACLQLQSRDQSSSLYEFCSDEEDRRQKTERGHEDPDDEDDSVLELEYADSNRGKSPPESEGSQIVGDAPALVDQLSDRREVTGTWRSTQSCDDIESIDGGLSEPQARYSMYEEAAPQSLVVDETDHPSVDYESNGVIWEPPPPVDEEDEADMSLVDEDDEDVEWVPRMPGSFSSSENRSKTAMRALVDGHFRALVAQLLIAVDIRFGEEGFPTSWLEIVSTLSLQASNLVKPDTSRGGGMDPGGYVKVKCIASGQREDSMVVNGIVCHKNVQNRRMISCFKNPRLLLLGGALEYHRVSNQLSSLDTLLQQERDHLSMTVARIEAHHPNVLLVEKTVSRYAQDKLLEKEISVVLNVKRPLLERIARCTGAQIVASPEYLMAPTAGQCELFHIEKFVEVHDYKGQGGRPGPKYLMFFEGCPRPLGCTVLLRGATTEELKSVKKVVQFAVFAAYHLALETSFLADEGATLPEFSHLSSLSTVNGTQRVSDRAPSGFSKRQPVGQETVGSTRLPSAGFFHQSENSFKLENTRDIIESSIAPGIVKDAYLPPLSDHQRILISVSSRCLRKGSVCEQPHFIRIKFYGSKDKPLGKFLKDSLFNVSSSCSSCEEPLDSHVHCYTHRQGSLTISVQRLRSTVLPGEKDGRIWMWHRCLRCPRTDGVPPATRRLVMSDAAWGLSFGKFLELSFSNHGAASRAAACGHSLHRDCLRFYGCGNFVACFKYATINLHSVAVPPPQIEFHNPKQQGWLLKESAEVADKSNLVFAEIFNALGALDEHIASSKLLYSSAKLSDARRQIMELESLLQKEKAEVEENFQKAVRSNSVQGHMVADILALNKLRRHLADTSAAWDRRIYNLSCSLLWRQQQPRGSDTGFLDSLFLLKVGNASYERSREAEKSLTIQEELTISANLDMGTQTELEHAGGIHTGPMIIQSAHEQHNWNGPHKTSGECCTAGDNVAEIFSSSVASNDPVDADFTRNLISSSVSGVHPLLLDEPEESSVPILVNSLAFSRQLASPFRVSVDLEVPGSADSEEPVQEGYLVCSQAMTSLGCPGKQEAELNAAWAKNSIVFEGGGLHNVILAPENTASVFLESSQVDSIDVPLDVKQVVERIEPTFQANRPTFPGRVSGKDKDVSEGGAGTFINVYSKTMCSRPGSTQSSSAGFPTTPMIVSLTGHLSAPGAARSKLPPGVSDTIINVYDDEPTSIIAYALLTPEYQADLREAVAVNDRQKPKEKLQELKENEKTDFSSMIDSIHHLDESIASIDVKDDLIHRKLFRTASMNVLTPREKRDVKVSFTDSSLSGKVEFRVTCYYAKQFDALRKNCCGGDMDYIRSMSRCRKWGAHGGKSNVFFAKTMDDRFVVKQVTSTEKISFLGFAPQYFNYLTESLRSGSPTSLAKIVGLYRVSVKQAKGNKELDLLVMENLLYARNVTRLYDLKGSVRSRYNSDLTGNNKVLLDENLLEMMPTSPIFVSGVAKHLLSRAVWNDTGFLARVHVMDYSLLVGVDEERQELVLGIIDFIRQYTWDKHMETWVKASRILGGSKSAAPTVISPKQYKIRFRKAMSTYFFMVPDEWNPQVIRPRGSSESAFPEDAASRKEAIMTKVLGCKL